MELEKREEGGEEGKEMGGGEGGDKKAVAGEVGVKGVKRGRG